MPKRTKGEKLKYYTEKIRKLNEINNRRSIRRRIIQSESSDENSDVETQSQYNQNEGSLPRAVLIDDEIMERDIRMEAVDTPQVETGTPEVASHPELTFEYLQALGDAVDEVPQYGEEIHSNLALRKTRAFYQEKRSCYETIYILFTTAAGKLDRPSPLPVEQGGAYSTAGGDDDVSGATGIGGEHTTTAVASSLQPSKQATCLSDASTLTQVARARTTPLSFPGSSDTLRLAFSRRGVPDQALDLICASLSANTIRQYSVTFKVWWEFCILNKFNPLEPSVHAVISFITHQYNRGDSYGSISTHRSALSLLLGHDVGTDDRISRILKGVYKLRPSVPKYKNTWDPQVVLSKLETWYPNSELSLEKLTKKLVMLLALCTAHRLQTFSLIKINNIKCFASVIKIYIIDIIKTSRPGKDQPILSLPFFLENPSICPAKTLQEYIAKTINLRPSNVENLLITFKRPHKAATAQTIGRWLKHTMGECGVDVAVFSAHSTRHAATSAAHSSGVSIDVIRYEDMLSTL
ncbi:unnamed protein product, partial [Brenthis ino]